MTLAFLLFAVLTFPACGKKAPQGEDEDNPCAETILEVHGRIQPETSGLSCAVIKGLISSVPAVPGSYLMLVGTPPKRWKCRSFPSSSSSPDLLICVHDKKEFAVGRLK